MANVCVIGTPVAHSLSPKLHGFWLKKYNIQGSYVAQEIRAEQLPEFIKTLPERFAGCNVTLPHKEAVIPLLDEVDDIAKAIGAANTIIVTSEGKRKGTNTDAFGFIENIKAHAVLEGRKQKAVVLGAGGAAKAVVKALIDEGFAEVHVTNRTRDKAEQLKQQFGKKIIPMDWDKRSAILTDADLLVNTTSLGLKNNPPLELDLSALPKHAIVNDIVYNPLVTPLLAQAEAAGYETVDGLGMLIYQAMPGFDAWFGRMPEVTQELRDYLTA